MALRFNKRIKIAPGIKLNVGKKGVSTTIGMRGASVNVEKKGAHLNAGIPGTGLSSRTKISSSSRKRTDEDHANEKHRSTWGDRLFMFIGVAVIVGFLVWLF